MSYVPDRSVGPAQQRGFSLIEAMFSALILAIALLGLAGFQVAAMSDASLVKARSVAANLAQEKLDDLRGFTHVVDDPSTTTVDECAAPTFCFSEIADDAGGAEESGGALVLPSGAVEPLVLASGDVAEYLDSYSIAWDVTCSTETAGIALSFGASCTDAVAKLATVTVSWTDSKGAAQTVSLQGVIYAMDPARMAGGLTRSFSSARPRASYTPVGVPDAVPVPINTGTGEYKESSKPVPDVVSNGGAAEVSFDAVSYVQDGGGYKATEQEEFVTTACECGFSTGSGYTPSRMVWNGTKLVAKVGEQVSKPVGTAASGQSDLCNACCKDHHDVSGSVHAKYDPDRPDSEYTGGGDHKHYWYTSCIGVNNCTTTLKNTSLGSGTPFTEVTTGAYLESCRFKRVDGIWRLWQDWRQVKMTVMPYDFLTTDENLDAYVGVIEAVVENKVRDDSGNGSVTIPTLGNRNVTFTATGQTKQLLGRAVFVDRVYEADNPTTLDDAYYDKIVSLIDGSQDWLNIVPFFEANLTLLIDWTSSDSSQATVTSQAIMDITNFNTAYYDSFSRGVVTAVSAGTPTITATARIHNTGVNGGINTASPSSGISTYDNTNFESDSISVTVPSSSSTAGISGWFQRANVSVDFATLSIGTGCTLQTPIGGKRDFTCVVAQGSSPTLTYSSSASGYAFDPSSLSYTNVTSAITDEIVIVYGPTVQISGTIRSNARVTTVSATSGSCSGVVNNQGYYTSYSCDVPRGTSGYSGTVTFTGTSPTPASQSYSNQQSDVVQNVN
ncbi:MAG: prepilin-type N-terminal cleavage/methylation domain-containing protein [Thiobacillus sp.]|nr:prepilin-type N-terminal cleavage/methylation domain-containing protein [Thiobacillus sp.]